MDPLEPTQPKRFPKLLLLAVVAILALAGLIWSGYIPLPTFLGQKPEPYTKMLPKLSESSATKVPALFPKQFILGVNPEVVEARVIDGSATSTAITLRFADAQNSVQALYDEYLDYAPRAFWMVEESDLSAELATLKFSRGVQRVSISIEPASSGGLTVDIDYRVVVNP